MDDTLSVKVGQPCQDLSQYLDIPDCHSKELPLKQHNGKHEHLINSNDMALEQITMVSQS